MDSDPVFVGKYLKAKIKSYNKTTNGKTAKEGITSVCLSAIVIDSVFKWGKNY